MDRRRHTLLSVATALLALQLAAGGAAVASTQLGQTGPGSSGSSCSGGPDWELIQGSRADGTSYAAPSAGVITSWKFQADAQATTLTLRVFRLVSGTTFTAVADGGPLQAVPAHTVGAFTTRVPVRAGDRIGLRSTIGSCVVLGANTNDTLLYHSGIATPIGGTSSFTTSGAFGSVQISAVFEADVDGDGFGDDTQDACPASAATQSPCPAPNTTITKKPITSGGKTKVSFSGSIAGSTFACSLDGKKAKKCTSPKTYKCLKAGSHTFAVTATSPFGISDPTPATKKFQAPHSRGC